MKKTTILIDVDPAIGTIELPVFATVIDLENQMQGTTATYLSIDTLVDESGNILTDESGNVLVGAKYETGRAELIDLGA